MDFIRPLHGRGEIIGGRKNCLTEIHLERPEVIDIGLMAILKCPDLEILHLVKAPDCSNEEICAVAEKFARKRCRVTDLRIDAFASGCPNLVKIKVEKCMGVAGEDANWLRTMRVSLTVNLYAYEIEPEAIDFTKLDGKDLLRKELVRPLNEFELA
ncbi:F-box protein [Forsythia ovata]|uniref:F-box protein n=1 Tax=Forsythia ovata TaxID=205694 RepID=A0ABD1TRD7_9LAMI